MSLAVTTRAAPILRRLGLAGALLLAALLCDLVIVATAVLDGAGNPFKDLMLLPGILGMTGCALLGRKHCLRAAALAIATLLGSSALLDYFDVAVYDTLLVNISFAETVAGIELLYLCVRLARARYAVGATAGLVASCLLATNYRDTIYDSIRVGQVFGLVLLVGTVTAAIYQRRAHVSQRPGTVPGLLRTQWPLIGVLALPLFGGIYSAADGDAISLAVLLCSVLANVLAVLAARMPARAGIGLAATILASGAIIFLLEPSAHYPMQPGIPWSQIAAGVVTVIFVVRYTAPATARNVIALLSVAVAISALLNTGPPGFPVDPDVVRWQVLWALLLLGISVATGLFLRSRDSERNQVIRAAMHDAQTSERMALARELHDVVAHHVTGIVVAAQAAKTVGATDPAVADEAFDRIETSGTDALVAMRRLVGSMREDDHEAERSHASEQASTDLDADLRGLARQVSAGMRIEFDLAVPPDLPQEIARSALRVTQEALTNVNKHAADATLVTVSASLAAGALCVRIIDDGNDTRSEPSGGSGGYGLIGMRERVELLGGRLSAGRRDGGWCVEVQLPVEAAT